MALAIFVILAIFQLFQVNYSYRRLKLCELKLLRFKTNLYSLEIPDIEPNLVPLSRKSRFVKRKGEAELYRDLFGNNRYNKWIRHKGGQ